MPRPPRLLLSQSYYHIMTRGNNRHKVFESRDDYDYYMKLIRRFKAEHPFDLYHYCLIPNHTHFLIKTNKASDFSTFMKRINLAYFHHYRQNYGWVGHLWQDRYKSQAVGKDAYFIQCGKYIELNPVRKGIVKDPEDYSYSSFQYYSTGRPDSLITRDIFYDDLGDNDRARQEKYKEIIISDIVTSNYQKPIWGSDNQRYQEIRKYRYHQK